MNRIYKYPLANVGHQLVTLPIGAKPLVVQVQHDVACLWAQVDDACMETTVHEIYIYGTGHALDRDPGVYLGTIQLLDGAFVGHVYDKVRL